MPKSVIKSAKKVKPAPTYTELLELLDNLVSNVVEDLPKDERTKHLNEAVLESLDAIKYAFKGVEKAAPKRTVLINLTGGCVHEIRATPGLEDVLFMFSGDENDCDPDARVKLAGDMLVYTTSSTNDDAPLSASESTAIHKAARAYNGV